MEGREYIGIVDEFMELFMHGGLKQLSGMYVMAIFCLITQSCVVAKLVRFHFEDMHLKWTFKNLQRCLNQFGMFNDDTLVRWSQN
jgi:hypothetical protein